MTSSLKLNNQRWQQVKKWCPKCGHKLREDTRLAEFRLLCKRCNEYFINEEGKVFGKIIEQNEDDELWK